jgi:hypothetical protein
MVGTAAKKTAQRTWGIIALAVGVLVFFFGISLYTHLAGLPPMPQPLHYGLTRPWELTPRIPRIGIVLAVAGFLLVLTSFFTADRA